MSQYDVIVVGLGALGSAAAYHAAKKGAKVLGLEQFGLGHVHGASHDTSRIVRTSYNTPEYVVIAKAAYKDWAVLEAEAKQKLLTITGGLIFFPKTGGELNSGQYAQSLKANDIPFEILSPDQVHRRWPQFSMDSDTDAVYTPDTGMAHASRSVAAMQWLATFHGADIKERTKVTKVSTPRNGIITVDTANGRLTTRKVILAADAWTNELTKPLGVDIPLVISQEQVTYFKPTRPDDFEDRRFPVWISMGREESFYGFPCFGEPSIKAAQDSAKNYMDPSNRTYVHSEQLLKNLQSRMNSLIPDKGRQVLRTATCQYTVTPNRQLIVGPIQKHPGIIVLLGAAQGFKFAPALGRVAAELALDGKTDADISNFSIPKVALLNSKL
ncbi:hypothetical protein M409DRAFT_61538 [Zasmidium cellare ATCC 36951]|uniref:sarcosine oxidasee (formaldehyde-forming) n=1 Tax=Zasmidium cellare ATCC 36951 TaxID=1080233 RepID=A0A6A6BUZ6_ZASCE|nr:uncharacterized protein M409DRAFT_61538 [Zasmidium cellare ATCC 36951]KAF2158561.1 hypothetical protein M409DRAFT_61538 [Zasmidium cellare ATCC 36951]